MLGKSKGATGDYVIAPKSAGSGLNEFLGSALIQPSTSTSGTAAEEESQLVQYLKQMKKSCDTTKLKSLRSIKLILSKMEEVTISHYVPKIMFIIKEHTHHPNPTVRLSVYSTLHTLMNRDKVVKQAMVPELAEFAGPWMMAMQDIEPRVQQEALNAFHAAFSLERRPLMLYKYKEVILNYPIKKIEAVMESATVKNLEGENEANILYSALLAMGSLIKQVSESQAALVVFLETPVLQKLIPQQGKPGGKEKHLVSSPQVRSGILTLLRDVVTVCPSTPTIHQLVGRALDGSVMDSNVLTAKRVWELLLFWCHAGGSSIISYFPARFLDTVIDSIMKCETEELSDIIFPSICPLLAQLSKDPQGRCTGVVDEFCGAMIEKIHCQIQQPTLPNKVVGDVGKALLSCWELHTIRSSCPMDNSMELFTVMLLNFSELLAVFSKHQQWYMEVLGDAIAKSLLKTLVRVEDIFKQCMNIVCLKEGTSLALIAQTPTGANGPSLSPPGLPQSYAILQSATIGCMCRQVATESHYSRQTSTIEGYFTENILRWLDTREVELAAFAMQFSGPDFVPSAQSVEAIGQKMVEVFQEWEQISEGVGLSHSVEVEKLQAGKELLEKMLNWSSSYPTDVSMHGLLEVAESLKNAPSIRRCVEDFFMRDSDKLMSMLCNACHDAQFNEVERYVQFLNESGSLHLSPALQQDLLNAIGEALTKECVTMQQKSDETMGSSSQLAMPQEVLSPNTCEDMVDDFTSDDSSCSGQGEADSKKIQPTSPLGSSLGHEENKSSHQLEQWIVVLHPDNGSVGSLLTDVRDHFFEPVGHTLLLLLSLLAPCLYPEYYLSLKALRIALKDAEDDLVDAIEEKTHYVTTNHFQQLAQSVKELLSKYNVSKDEIDQWCEDLWGRLLDSGEDESTDEAPPPLSLLATHQLQQITPLASPALLSALASSEDMWEDAQVPALVQGNIECVYDGHYSIDQMSISLYSAVRSSQMIRLMDYCMGNGFFDSSTVTKKGNANDELLVTRTYLLLRAAMTKEILSAAVLTQLYKLLRLMILKVTSAFAAKRLVERIIECEVNERDLLICTFSSVVHHLSINLDPTEKKLFGQVIPPIVGQLTEFMIRQTLSESGAAGISVAQTTFYATFFQHLDKAADNLKMDLLSPISEKSLHLFREAFGIVTTFDFLTVKMSLMIHRHLAVKMEISTKATKSLIAYTQNQRIVDGLEVLAELSCCRVLDPVVFGELVQTILHSLSRSYTLKHLPTNGRLKKLMSNLQSSTASLDFLYLRRVVLAAINARTGVVLHSRLDGVLRSTVNLVIYDAVCECVTHLRSPQKTNVPFLTRLLSLTVEFLNSLQPQDVSILRASEASTNTIASMFVFVYLWFCGTSIAKLEAFGLDTIAGVMRAACQLSNLTLMYSGVPLVNQLTPVLNKLPTKPLRLKFSSVEPIKLHVFLRHSKLLRKTQKHKLALFPYLLAWGEFLTNSAPSPEWEAVINRNNIYTLMDLVTTLLLSPLGAAAYKSESLQSAGPSLEDQPTSQEVSATPSAQRKRVILNALTCTDDLDEMSRLIEGSTTLLHLLLQGRMLVIVKGWMDTVDKRVQEIIVKTVHEKISDELVQQTLKEVLVHSPDGSATFSLCEKMKVEVNMAGAYVSMDYEIEDERLIVRIIFPPEYPLSPPRVEYRNEKEYGISMKKWRSWMMRMTAKLFGGGTNIWDCIVLFQRNVDAHFQGLEPCPICFAVVSTDNKIPELSCAICHNSKFHASCLYTWWDQGGNSICPLCRSPWIS